MQVVGNDLHITAFLGAQQMMDEAAEHGLDVAWVEAAEKPKHSHSVGASSQPHCMSARVAAFAMLATAAQSFLVSPAIDRLGTMHGLDVAWVGEAQIPEHSHSVGE